MKKLIAFILILALTVLSMTSFVYASDSDINNDNGTNNEAESEIVSGENLTVNSESAVLMDATTGAVLYAKNASKALAPASVTKIMTLLLVAEAIDDGRISLDDVITVSANATSMGGSQIFLKEGEQFTVEELLKSTVIASANDAAVALAEHVAGSEDEFVSLMNSRAHELGMVSTSFENATGLDDTTVNHKTSAYDIALMSRELITHDIILKYSNVWQDSIRNGEFILTNTNRLVRYYSGCTGLKTGSTDKAGYCVSATAERNGMHLIAVIMGAETRDERNEAARTLLDWGFASYALYNDPCVALETLPILRGRTSETVAYSAGFVALIKKGDLSKVERTYEIPESLCAPIEKGQVIGGIIYRVDGEEIGRCDIVVNESIGTLSLWEIFVRILGRAISG